MKEMTSLEYREYNEKKRINPAVVSFILTVLAGLVYFYINLPAINFHSGELYSGIIFLCVLYLVLTAVLSGIRPNGFGGYIKSVKKGSIAPLALIAAALITIVIGSVSSATILRAGSYRKLMDVKQGDFTEDVKEISFDSIPMLDKDSAERLGDRKMGELSDVVSQFEVTDAYTQINYKNRPVRVTYLEYGDVVKWLINRKNGLPAYVIIDMATQEASVVRLKDGMKYSPSEHFGRNLYRHIRFNYPTYMFSKPTFEIDEDGKPYWICPRIVKTIGLFGGTDVKGAVLVDAVTGESKYYETPPTWVDAVYPASLLTQQYDYYGAYVNGYINSVFGQKNVTRTTSGYNYIALNDDVYVYTGVTSVTGDQSNLGFILCNQRTKETKYYSAPGATEESAMSSAEGVVQNLKYNATFPILLNVASQPTYFMSLKDNANLVKMYAMVNVGQYQIVSTGTTVAECQKKYISLLAGNNISSEGAEKEFSGIITDIRSAVKDGNTYYYIKLDTNKCYFRISAATDENTVILNVGDSVKISSNDASEEIKSADNIKRGEE